MTHSLLQNNSNKLPSYVSITPISDNVTPVSCHTVPTPTSGPISSYALNDAENFVSSLVCHGMDITAK